MDFEAMGTTTCMQIDLNKLFKGGFSTGHGHLREPKDIMSYSALAAIAINLIKMINMEDNQYQHLTII